MKSNNFYNKSIGILGGGQLGKMLCVPAAYWNLKTLILDPSSDCPASIICNNIHIGDFTDFETVYRFGQLADVITIEIENVNTDALIKLKEEGKVVHPDPVALRIIQDKGLQKMFYEKNNLNSPAFILCENSEQVKSQIANLFTSPNNAPANTPPFSHTQALPQGGLSQISFPFVQKLRKAGYDGKGVSVINNQNDLHKLMDAPCVIEQKVTIKKELSVIAARDIQGNVKCFTLVEMVFDDNANLVTSLICPAQVSEKIEKEAEALAIKTINAFGIVGLLAVELFLNSNDELLINEVAPRPHNSGHHTIENAITSQYEQQLRAILGLPLGSTEMIMPSVMINLLGEPGYSGPVKYEGMDECSAIEGASFHIYGKAETKPFRKMGHVTIVDRSLESAIKKAERIQKTLKVMC